MSLEEAIGNIEHFLPNKDLSINEATEKYNSLLIEKNNLSNQMRDSFKSEYNGLGKKYASVCEELNALVDENNVYLTQEQAMDEILSNYKSTFMKMPEKINIDGNAYLCHFNINEDGVEYGFAATTKGEIMKEYLGFLSGGNAVLCAAKRDKNGKVSIQPIKHHCKGMIYETGVMIEEEITDKQKEFELKEIGETKDINEIIGAISNYQFQEANGGLFNINNFFAEALEKIGCKNAKKYLAESLHKGFVNFKESYREFKENNKFKYIQSGNYIQEALPKDSIIMKLEEILKLNPDLLTEDDWKFTGDELAEKLIKIKKNDTLRIIAQKKPKTLIPYIQDIIPIKEINNVITLIAEKKPEAIIPYMRKIINMETNYYILIKMIEKMPEAVIPYMDELVQSKGWEGLLTSMAKQKPEAIIPYMEKIINSRYGNNILIEIAKKQPSILMPYLESIKKMHPHCNAIDIIEGKKPIYLELNFNY